MNKELETAKELALRAGAILIQHFSAALSVQWKSEGDPVTAADQSANRLLVAELKKRFPEDGVLSEEESDDLNRLGKSRVWMVDPMDGTAEFIARRGEFAVMIGLTVEGRPVMGAMYQPTEDKLFYAARGMGAFVETGSVKRPLSVSPETDPDRLVVAVSRSHDSADAQSIRSSLGIRKVIRSGSAGLKVGMICEGRAHLYLHLDARTSEWDTCAPQIILQEAGGCLTDIHNKPLQYNAANTRNLHGLIASNALIHERAVEAVERRMAER